MAIGKGAEERLQNQISVTKYTLLFSNVLVVMMAIIILSLCMWLRFEPSMASWIDVLDIKNIYIGVFILIAIGAIMVIVGLIGCLAAMSENQLFTLVYIGLQCLCFVGSLAGSGVLLEYSTHGSKLGPMIRESMRRMIMNSHHKESQEALAMIQETISCCGADGPRDYTSLRQPLPSQCRDTVTGNPFFHGCIDELTWFFEEKTGWVAAIVMSVSFMLVINAVLAIILLQATKKENGDYDNTYRR